MKRYLKMRKGKTPAHDKVKIDITMFINERKQGLLYESGKGENIVV